MRVCMRLIFSLYSVSPPSHLQHIPFRFNHTDKCWYGVGVDGSEYHLTRVNADKTITKRSESDFMPPHEAAWLIQEGILGVVSSHSLLTRAA